MAREIAREDEIGFGWQLSTFVGLAVLALAWSPFIGPEQIPLSTLWDKTGDPIKAVILWDVRIPRVFMAFFAGVALAVSGMVFQAIFRNPLATPFTLGVSSGAALGAALAIQFGWTFAMCGVSGVSIAAFGGAILSIVLVYAMTIRSRRGATTGTMLLAGVAVSFFFSSLILFLQYISDFTRSFQMLRWTMGGLERIVRYREVIGVFPFVAAGCLIIWYFLFELNLLTTGEDFAFSRGVNVSVMKLMLFFGVSMMVGAVVSICGPIGFVGLMAPHICRLIVGADHCRLYPSTLFFGGAFLVICDTVARTVMAPSELPVGIITSLLGGPFFIWLLLARKRDFGEV